jgi:hypothetical protein
MRIRDPGWRQFGFGIKEGKKSDMGSRIRKKTNVICFFVFAICTVLYIYKLCMITIRNKRFGYI